MGAQYLVGHVVPLLYEQAAKRIANILDICLLNSCQAGGYISEKFLLAGGDSL